ncbi:hypothetical protein [Arcobacter peruensis]|uniref:hypothetical protein n=1 Tax=Arcobacter peruensis TaxID=2320140 RepID=UPI000F080280|nr:hypothetical protein [Arcobacter peruensis]
MPQLIAMVIVVVGAMIYMFQTFGGTGDKIEGIAQKTSIVTEINNIRNGLQLAVRAGDVTKGVAAVIDDPATTTVDESAAAIPAATLKVLASLGYFADQMNDEINDNTAVAGSYDATTDNSKTTNTYSAISFGGEDTPGMNLSLVVGAANTAPGIRVQLLNKLFDNRAFLESQISNDLSAIANIDRKTIDGTWTGASDSSANVDDGVFTIYFKDMPKETL